MLLKGAPEVPSISNVYQRQNYIVLEWKPKFDGGAPQGFIVQYRKKQDEIWESIWIQSNETNDFVHISKLKPDTEYELRMLAFNRLGNSSFTVQFTTLFKGRHCVFIHTEIIAFRLASPISFIILDIICESEAIKSDSNFLLQT